MRRDSLGWPQGLWYITPAHPQDVLVSGLLRRKLARHVGLPDGRIFVACAKTYYCRRVYLHASRTAGMCRSGAGDIQRLPREMPLEAADCRHNKTCGRSQKRRDTHSCVSSFLELHFCYAKVVACGRMTEREWGNPSKVPPHTPPSLRCVGVRTTKSAPSHKRNTICQEGVFFLEYRGQTRTRCLDRREAR